MLSLKTILISVIIMVPIILWYIKSLEKTEKFYIEAIKNAKDLETKRIFMDALSKIRRNLRKMKGQN
ncbi:hypothetical protein EV694_2126 [Volucribacter psittacicida]|uniref:Uncharacterized protein n=1 Tax=Volucribacter psittacicida TaxID=203482 RepID=A0A4R1FIL5_9PAST|nr:hypothetical protein [Volucribacter psittacicida]TCJ94696.1 hypothetical protein EV694_2126 [Volucribacter psittacicida]